MSTSSPATQLTPTCLFILGETGYVLSLDAVVPEHWDIIEDFQRRCRLAVEKDGLTKTEFFGKIEDEREYVHACGMMRGEECLVELVTAMLNELDRLPPEDGRSSAWDYIEKVLWEGQEMIKSAKKLRKQTHGTAALKNLRRTKGIEFATWTVVAEFIRLARNVRHSFRVRIIRRDSNSPIQLLRADCELWVSLHDSGSSFDEFGTPVHDEELRVGFERSWAVSAVHRRLGDGLCKRDNETGSNVVDRFDLPSTENPIARVVYQMTEHDESYILVTVAEDGGIRDGQILKASILNELTPLLLPQVLLRCSNLPLEKSEFGEGQVIRTLGTELQQWGEAMERTILTSQSPHSEEDERSIMGLCGDLRYMAMESLSREDERQNSIEQEADTLSTLSLSALASAYGMPARRRPCSSTRRCRLEGCSEFL